MKQFLGEVEIIVEKDVATQTGEEIRPNDDKGKEKATDTPPLSPLPSLTAAPSKSTTDNQPLLDAGSSNNPTTIAPLRPKPAPVSIPNPLPDLHNIFNDNVDVEYASPMKNKPTKANGLFSKSPVRDVFDVTNMKLRQCHSLLQVLKPTEMESSNRSLAHKIAPEGIFDKNTLRLPDSGDRTLPTTAHWYMASMNLLQKQALVRSLRSGACGVGLVERDTLVAVDLIIDPHTAVIFTNLLAPPSQVDTLVDTISEQSWRYDNLLVIFEAFAPSMAFKPDSATKSTSSASASSSLNAYSPPVIKAVRKFRRDMSLKEACGDKREGCRVLNAFADTVQDAAMIARTFGDEADKRSGTEVGLWGDRAWLDDEGGEDEDNLAAADGMNHFSACVILCQISVDDLLEMDPEERVARFTPHVGHDRMLTLNGVIDHGRQMVEASFAG
ncbi:hypothetical protein C8R42DRAFT_660854 [Lentinula raphanica]|nr:hypothetical protein C8R42DRAFT_660854 [Lentinula raphanica]